MTPNQVLYGFFVVLCIILVIVGLVIIIDALGDAGAFT